ncbi:O-succinylhomoserine sulfhydrylase [Corticibacter populi]|uniref:O-succinylhomoserine sulfhydrylase n=1 Tax=Corticibacter populi TaxID=1550736 RepID=A0A3M6R0V9_9BURK|nr:O-succinylhomoserine sulfhydrylase [Corticibacter populi]RMX08888.1 O-succinylhomoserine sulfhydrylase [Corticibacter populi]RZS35651.1 O-succinylhomoserine sulfhydrylase [Corticibacter populi]
MTDSTLPEGLHPQTLAVRQAIARSQYGEHSEALYLTSSYVQPDAATSARRFANEEAGYTYTRTSNPTVTSFERRLAGLEGTEAAIGTATGMAAIALMVYGLLKSGDHIVASRSMFGSTIKLLGSELARFGVETTFVSQTDAAEWRAAIRPGQTRLLFAETPTNPLTDVCDIATLADLAHNADAWLAVDNSFVTPALQQASRFGADLVIHSGTKFLEGQGRVLAGAVCGPRAIVEDKLGAFIRSAGFNLSPFNAWVVLKGMETLFVRMREQSRNALELAQWLQQQPQVARVHYPGLPSHPQHELAMRQQSGLGGAVLAFDVRGDSPEALRHNAFHVIDQCRVISKTTNLGDTKSTISHPASTSHGRLSEAQRQAAGVGQGLIRISVGLEYPKDIQDDVLRGLGGLS